MSALTFPENVAVEPLTAEVTLTFAAALTSAVTFAVPVMATLPVMAALPVMFAFIDALTLPVTDMSPFVVTDPKIDKAFLTL